MFKPGQELIVVDDNFGVIEDGVYPKLHEMVIVYEFHDWFGRPSVSLVGYEPSRFAFDNYHFKPIEEFLDDISIEDALNITEKKTLTIRITQE